MSQTVLVESLLWTGAQGGAIFRGTAEDDAAYRFVASGAVMPRAPVEGEVWKITGTRRNHAQHGEQVEVSHCVLQRPSGRLLTKVLAASKSFPGVGVVTARKLWDEFGEHLYDLLDAGDAATLSGLVGQELGSVLVEGWQEMSVESKVYRWLDSHGVPPLLSKKLIDIYGSETVEKLNENPYRLLAFTSWKQADRLGLAAGIVPDDPRRLTAAADGVVYLRLQAHHTSTPRNLFLRLLDGLLSANGAARTAYQNAVADCAIVEVPDDLVQGLGPHAMEVFVAERMADLVAGNFLSPQLTIRHTPDEPATMKLIADFEKLNNIMLNHGQKEAVRLAVTSPLAVITGGAGVGKTTVLSAITSLSETLGAHVYLLALSGRAARRMREATGGHDSQTIASWIKAVDEGRAPLDTEPTIAVDEASMLDLPTSYKILRRLRPGCRLILLGDPGQLPPINFGLVFHAVVQEPSIPQVKLTEIMRQTSATGIPLVSRELREGRVPKLPEYGGAANGVSFIECAEDQIVDTILDVVNDLGGIHHCRIIGSVKNGPAGVKTINHAYHSLLAAGKPQLHGFAVGEPVLFLRNDYDLGLLNGSLGTVIRTDPELVVDWDEEGEKTMDLAWIKNMVHAYALTCHKAQGSEFPKVIVPIHRSRLMDRTLLYTAVTRAQYQVVLVGDRSAYEAAIQNPPNLSWRCTSMGTHLAKAFLRA